MKKILMLGGAFHQVPAIKKAKEMGYYAIVCDFRPDSPGVKHADEFHNISVDDGDKILRLAKKLNVCGIVNYASAAASNAATYASEKMGFPHNPAESVKILSDKALYRAFLEKHSFNTPTAKGYKNISDAKRDAPGRFRFPVFVKPVDSSGSRGVTMLSSPENLEKQIEYALGFSKSKRFIIEENVEKLRAQVAGDGFSVDGRLAFRCFADEHFYKDRPFVPMGQSWPSTHSARIQQKIHNEIQRLLTLLEMRTSGYNFDIRVDKNENVFLMEVDSRNGGCFIPQMTKYATGEDLVECLIKSAVGEPFALEMKEPDGFWSSYMVQSRESGILKKVVLDEGLREKNLVETQFFAQAGDAVKAFVSFGVMMFKYSSADEMLTVMNDIDKYIKTEV